MFFSNEKEVKGEKFYLLRRVSTECWLTSSRDFSPLGLLSRGHKVLSRS